MTKQAVRTTRRTGNESSATRLLLLDATEQVMVEDGYAAVSSRRIAKRVGVTAALVHYYFPTLDDLFLAVLRRRADQQLERHEHLVNSPQPLHGLWAFSRDRAGTALLIEFMALANHRKEIAGEIARHAERFRKLELEMLTGRLEEYGIDTQDVPPIALLVVLSSVARTIVMDQSIGVSVGLAEVADLVERYLERYEGPR